jgi:predicted DCC family thiol-disulfide oxidoreductase YuxK
VSEGAAAGDLAASTPTGGLAVLYDRDCGICAATARRLRRWDRHARLELIPLQAVRTDASPGIARLATDRHLSSALHVVEPSTGRVHSRGDAVLEIARLLPAGSGPARLVATIPPARWAVGVAYDVVARNRHRIGRWLRLEGPQCDVPS